MLNIYKKYLGKRIMFFQKIIVISIHRLNFGHILCSGMFQAHTVTSWYYGLFYVDKNGLFILIQIRIVQKIIGISTATCTLNTLCDTIPFLYSQPMATQGIYCLIWSYVPYQNNGLGPWIKSVLGHLGGHEVDLGVPSHVRGPGWCAR